MNDVHFFWFAIREFQIPGIQNVFKSLLAASQLASGLSKSCTKVLLQKRSRHTGRRFVGLFANYLLALFVCVFFRLKEYLLYFARLTFACMH